MRITQDARFRAERVRYALRFCCESCALFDEATRACAHGYPIEDHERDRYEDPEADVVFCKDWDLA